jgi:hypothetical protein
MQSISSAHTSITLSSFLSLFLHCNHPAFHSRLFYYITCAQLADIMPSLIQASTPRAGILIYATTISTLYFAVKCTPESYWLYIVPFYTPILFFTASFVTSGTASNLTILHYTYCPFCLFILVSISGALSPISPTLARHTSLFLRMRAAILLRGSHSPHRAVHYNHSTLGRERDAGLLAQGPQQIAAQLVVSPPYRCPQRRTHLYSYYIYT